jgi:hypothetical protein
MSEHPPPPPTHTITGTGCKHKNVMYYSAEKLTAWNALLDSFQAYNAESGYYVTSTP